MCHIKGFVDFNEKPSKGILMKMKNVLFHL